VQLFLLGANIVSDIYFSKPHKIRAFKIVDMRIKPPSWFMDAYKIGKVSVINNVNNKYIIIYNDDGVRKAFVGDWVCLNDQGNIFPLSDDEFISGFQSLDNLM